jgi:hypothetical protein
MTVSGEYPGKLIDFLLQALTRQWSGCLKMTHSSSRVPLFIDLEQGVIQSVLFHSRVTPQIPGEIEGMKGWEYSLLRDLKEIVTQKIAAMRQDEISSSHQVVSYEVREGIVSGGEPANLEFIQSEFNYTLYYGYALGQLFEEEPLVGYLITSSDSNLVAKFNAHRNPNDLNSIRGEITESTDPLFGSEEVFPGDLA